MGSLRYSLEGNDQFAAILSLGHICITSHHQVQIDQHGVQEGGLHQTYP